MQDFFEQLFDGQLSLLEGQVLIMLVGIPMIVLVRRFMKAMSARSTPTVEAEPEPELKVKRIPRESRR